MLVVFLIMRAHIQAFVSLVIVCFYVGFVTGMPLNGICKSIEAGMGSTLGFLATVLGFGSILGKMLECISEPNKELSPYAPRVETVKIKVDQISDVIGKGGKVVKGITEETGVQVDIHEDGNIFLTSSDAAGMAKAKQMIEDIVHEIKPGEIYTGRVTRLMKFGAFVELLPGREGLCHISQLAKRRVENVEDVVQVGDQLQVKVTEIDDRGRINVSHKVLL